MLYFYLLIGLILSGCDHSSEKQTNGSVEAPREVLDIFKTMEAVERECIASTTTSSGVSCVHGERVKVRYVGDVSLVAANSPDATSDAYVSKDRRFSVKISREDPICRELAVLTAVSGLNRAAPKAFEVDPSVSCRSRILVTEFPGDGELKSLGLSAANPLLYALAARILEIVRDLHGLRIVHGDIRASAFTFSDAGRPLETLKLLDFAIASLYANADGSRPPDALGTVKGDLVAVGKMLLRLARVEVFEAFEKAAMSANANGPFDYNGWIARFVRETGA